MNIGMLIREERLKQEITLEQLSKDIEVSSSYLSRLESGKRIKPSVEIILRLQKRLKCNILFNEELYIPQDILQINTIIVGDKKLNENQRKELQKTLCNFIK